MTKWESHDQAVNQGSAPGKRKRGPTLEVNPDMVVNVMLIDTEQGVQVFRANTDPLLFNGVRGLIQHWGQIINFKCIVDYKDLICALKE